MASTASSRYPDTLTLHIVDEAGNPIPNATGFHRFGKKTNFSADAQGVVKIDLNAEPSWKEREYVIVEIHTPDYAPCGIMFRMNSTFPTDFQATLRSADRIGGRLIDSQGEPLADVQVEVVTDFGTKYEISEGFTTVERVQTDADGFWFCVTLPKGKTGDVPLTFMRPDYADFSVRPSARELRTEKEGQFVRTDIYPEGIRFEGIVRNAKGEPVEGAKLWGKVDGMSQFDCVETITDAEGRFSFKSLNESKNALIIAGAKNYGPALVEQLEIKPDMKPVELQLTEPNEIRLRVVDSEGNPVPDIVVGFDSWRDYRFMNGFLFNDNNESFGKTDAEGRWVWKNAPLEPVRLNFFNSSNSGKQFSDKSESFTPRLEEYIVELLPELVVSGQVTDKMSGQIIPNFIASLGLIPKGAVRAYWDGFALPKQTASNGHYSFGTTQFSENAFIVRIEADGYRTAFSRQLEAGERGMITLDFALEKEEKGDRIAGRCIDENGEPVFGVTVEIATAQNVPFINSGELRTKPSYQAKTDEEGRFVMPQIDLAQETRAEQANNGALVPRENDYLLVFVGPEHFQIVTQKEFESNYRDAPILLKKWGHLKGTLLLGTKPGANQEVDLEPPRMPDFPYISFQMKETTDANGRFVFDKVPPGEGNIYRFINFAKNGNSYSSALTDRTGYRVEPGQTAEITVGSVGRPLTGKLVVPDDFALTPDWNFALVRVSSFSHEMSRIQEEIGEESKASQLKIESLQKELVPPEIQRAMASLMRTEDDIQKVMEWAKTDTGKDFFKKQQEIYANVTKLYEQLNNFRSQSELQRRAAAVEKDGSFRVEGVTGEEVAFSVELTLPSPKGTCGIMKTIGTLTDYRVTLPPLPEGISVTDEPFDVGELVLEKVQEINVGETISLDEITAAVPESKGKYVVLEFGTTWCAPCLESIPEMKSIYESQIKDDDRLILISICVESEEEKAETLRKIAEEHEIEWPQLFSPIGTGGIADVLCIKSFPTFVVIEPNGRIVFVKEGYSSELSDRLEALKSIMK